MPSKPPHPCAHPGCPKLTLERFCEEHAKAEARRIVKAVYGEKADVIQTEGAERGAYSKEWRAIR